jgi:signal transduction histidine kinase
VLLEDVTQSVEHAYQLSMLRQINEAVQTTLDLKRLLRLVLTCATSGQALGFNRAILLMVNKAKNRLEGRLAVGPKDPEDAARIWQSMNEEGKSFKQLLNEADDGRPDEEMPLYHIAERLTFPLDSEELIVRVVRDKQVAQVVDAQNDARVGREFREIVGSDSFVCVPLVAKDEAVGAIVVDNLYSGRPISPDQIELLTIYANHVGLAIENAEAYDALHKQIGKLQEAYRELRETQGKLVQSEKLAAVGEVAAHVAHEIRNPLVTIGGFARNIQRQLDPDHPCTRSIGIVIEEVARLEKILANVMDFSKPSAPWKRPTKINQIIRNTSVLLSEELKAYNVTVEEQLDPNLPLVMLDAEQLKQALLNIIKNAAQSMSDGGVVTVRTRLDEGMVWIDVSDTGKGIAQEMLPNLFDPFFTTRPDGTGLGLAVTRKIVVDHGGDISVESKLGSGTTFTISLPADVPATSRRRQASLERSRIRDAQTGSTRGNHEEGEAK